MAYISAHYDQVNKKKPDVAAFDRTEWYKGIDESLDLATIIEVKDEIKKCYSKQVSS